MQSTFFLTIRLLIPCALLLLSGELTTAQAQEESSQAAGGDETDTRVYYVAAEPVTWNYAPSGIDQVKEVRFDTASGRFPGSASEELSSELTRYPTVVRDDYMPGSPGKQEGIGPIYDKVLFRAYTDSTFTQKKTRPPKWEHLGLLGPVLRAEVGDTIKVVFKNKAGRPYSVHPHGVFYKKDSEGFGYRDGTSGSDRADDAVAPGDTHTYVWPVPPRAGPGPSDPSSLLWMYHSHVHEDEDVNTGLIGPMIVTRRGMAGPEGVPRDIDREVIAYFARMDETNNWHFGENIRQYAGLSADSATAQPSFEVTNVMRSINGYVYGNMPTPTFRQGNLVRWYVFAGVNRLDHHTVRWEGHTSTFRGSRTQSMELGPMMMGVADMRATEPGTWLIRAEEKASRYLGMTAFYEVLPAETATSTDR